MLELIQYVSVYWLVCFVLVVCCLNFRWVSLLSLLLLRLHGLSNLTRNCSIFDGQILGGGFENLFLNFLPLLSLQLFGHRRLQEETLRHSCRLSEYRLEEEDEEEEAEENNSNEPVCSLADAKRHLQEVRRYFESPQM